MIGALSLLPFCGPVRADEGSWRARLDRAEQLSGEGKNAESAAAAEGVLADAEKSLGPEDSEINGILSRLSRIYEAAEDVSHVSEMEKRLSSIKSKDFAVWLALGAARRFQERFLEAQDALKKALALKPDDSQAQRELAMVDHALGRDDEAVKFFERAIRQGPRDYDLYMQLARSDMRLGRLAEAKAAFAQAKKLDGKSLEAYIDEGYFHLERGEIAQGKEAFESAIAVDTASPFGYHHMGAYLSHNGEYAEAEKYFRQALERLEANPTARTDDLIHTIVGLGDAIRRQGRSAEAETVFRKCLEKEMPSSLYVDCLQELGEIYASEGKNAQAEDIFKRAADACEDGPACTCRGLALINLGDFYLKQGRKREVSAMADEAGKLCAGYLTSNFSLLMDLAGLYMSSGDVVKGEALYGRILAVGRSMPFHRALAWALARMADLGMTQGRFREAEGFYRQAIPIFENHGDEQQEAAMFDGIAAACEKESKPQEAAEAREKAKSLRAGNPSFPSAALKQPNPR